MRKFVTALTIVAASLFVAPPVEADSGYALAGWAELGGTDDFTYEMPNPEANFDKTCARGANGWAPWLRVGKRFPVYDGIGRQVGTLRVTSAQWVEDYGVKGNCNYYFSGTNLKRANFYCIRWPFEVTESVGRLSKAVNGVVPFSAWIIGNSSGSAYVDPDCGG